jgi:ribonuclease-3
LVLGKGMTTHQSVPPSLLADVFESLVAATYLDGGEQPARELIMRFVGPEIARAASGEVGANHKSMLQQVAQRDGGTTPTYRVIDEKGPDHSKRFLIAARVGDRQFVPAWGRNKKDAEQRAAQNALAVLRGADVPYPSEESRERPN